MSNPQKKLSPPEHDKLQPTHQPVHVEQTVSVESEAAPASESNNSPQSMHQAVDSLNRASNNVQRQALILNIQRHHGNQFAQRVLRTANRNTPSGVVQRHPPGAALLGGIGPGLMSDETVVTPPTGDNSAPTTGGDTTPPSTTPPTTPPTTTPPTGDTAPPTGGTTPPTGDTTPPTTTPPTTTPPTTTPPTTTPPTTTPPTTVPTTPPPIVLGLPTLQASYAQNALQSAFGTVAGRTIIPGNIHVVADNNALLAAYDKWMIDRGRTNTNVTPNRLWQVGDKKKIDTDGGFRTNAFAEPPPSVDIYIDATQTDPTATVHEMLHVNTNSDFHGKVGTDINEGMTQRLSVQAVKAKGNSVVGSENTYQAEQRIVDKLVSILGEGLMKSSYFGGADPMIAAYDKQLGTGSWTALKRLLDKGKRSDAILLLDAASVDQRIKSINALLDYWVKDSDLDAIETIVGNATPEIKTQIGSAIKDRIPSLFSEKQRARLKAILGV
jgi:hypothetical protein